jgi:hypothetical protein
MSSSLVCTLPTPEATREVITDIITTTIVTIQEVEAGPVVWMVIATR